MQNCVNNLSELGDNITWQIDLMRKCDIVRQI